MRALAPIFFASLLFSAACGGGDATPQPTATPTSTSQPTSTTATAVPTASPTAGPVDLLHVFGTILIDGVPPPDGARLEVFSLEDQCAEGVVTALAGQATYSLMIPTSCSPPWRLRINGFEVGQLSSAPERQDLAFSLGTATAIPPPTSTPSPTSTGTPSPTATPGPDDYLGQIETEIRDRGFEPTGAPAAIETGPGEFLIAYRAICAESVDGACQAVFFFVNDRFIATDAENPWFGISDPEALDTGAFRLTYVNYLPDDPLCCPSGEPDEIEFTWDGSSLVSSAIPPGDRSETILPETYFPSIQAEVESRGFTPIGDPVVEGLPDGSYFIAQDSLCTGSASGYCASIFFFINDAFLATDTDEANYGTLSVFGNGDGTITAEYPVYFTGDPNCCPSGEPFPITFSYDGTSLVSSAIPPPPP